MICTFDRDEEVPGPGEPIAPGWHLCFCIPCPPRFAGKDGAAAEGGVLPRSPCRGACTLALPSRSTVISASATS
jgi:hypothetical protein